VDRTWRMGLGDAAAKKTSDTGNAIKSILDLTHLSMLQAATGVLLGFECWKRTR
jgi:hypothetical protein